MGNGQCKQNTLRIAHLRIGYLVGNPEVGNPDPYQYSELPTSIITLLMCCPGPWMCPAAKCSVFQHIILRNIEVTYKKPQKLMYWARIT